MNTQRMRTSRQQLIKEPATLADRTANGAGADAEPARELALEEAAQAINKIITENGTQVCCGNGERSSDGSPGCCGQPDVMINAGDVLAAIRALSSPNHADAGKLVEGDGSAAARDVLAERRRQIEAEGWTPEHDDTHAGGEMAFAAASYVIGVSTLTGAVSKGELSFPWAYRIWPRAWDLKWWKPSDRRRNLVKAGALILAEIERLDRLSAPASEGAE